MAITGHKNAQKSTNTLSFPSAVLFMCSTVLFSHYHEKVPNHYQMSPRMAWVGMYFKNHLIPTLSHRLAPRFRTSPIQFSLEISPGMEQPLLQKLQYSIIRKNPF